MSTTITIRTDVDLKQALQEHARKRGLSVSEVAREILREAVSDAPMAPRIRHLRGSLTLDHDEPADGWRTSLRQRNWRA